MQAVQRPEEKSRNQTASSTMQAVQRPEEKSRNQTASPTMREPNAVRAVA